MNIEKYKEMPKLTEQEIRAEIDNLFNFLKLTHPFLEDRVKNFYDPTKSVEEQINADTLAIELRVLKRDKEGNPFRNFKLYRFADTEKERLFNFLTKLNNKNIPFCIYYSVYCLDTNILAVTKEGKVSDAWNNKVAINNAIATQMLVMDFDEMDEDEFILEKIKLLKLGIETIDIMSGHGFQSIILLDKITHDKELVRKFTNLLLKKGFRVDYKIKDCARIMRPPILYNCKEFIKTTYDNPVAIKTFTYSSTEKRYNLEDVINRLESLETVVEIEDIKEADAQVKESESSRIEIKKVEEIEKIEERHEIEDCEYDIERLRKLYPTLDIDSLEKPILKMLEGFRNHHANNMLLVLVLYLKEKGYSKSAIITAMITLGEQDRFNYPWSSNEIKKEADRFYYSNYNWRGIFANNFKSLGFIEYGLIEKDIIVINNHVFKNLYKISSSAFYIYLKLLLKQNMTGKNSFTINEMCEVVGYKRRAILKHLDDLVSSGLMDKKRANRRQGEEYTYYLSMFISQEFGFTKINKGSVKLLLNMVDFKQLNQTQMTICIYFKYICYGNKTESNIGQETLAEALGVNKSTISRAITGIEKTELIYREKEEILHDFKFKYNYTIHY